MKVLLDYLPLALFFICFKLFDIYVATAVAIGASVVVIAAMKFMGKKIETMMWVNVGVIVVAGGATLLFHDEKFIKWKPTILFAASGIALAFGQFVLKKNPAAAILKGFELPRTVWDKVVLGWVALFLGLAVLNYVVAFALDVPTATWVNIKVFGFTAVIFVFIVAQVLWLQKYLPEEAVEVTEKKE